MFASIRYPHRSAALTAFAVAATALLAVPGTSGGEAPASQPLPAAAQLSPSGKIVDRLPGNSAMPPRFAGQLARPGWVGMAAPPPDARPASAIVGGLLVAEAAAAEKPAAASDSRPHASPVQKPARVSAQAQKRSATIAALPPQRPASPRASQNATEVAGVKEKPVSVTARMIAFVGSLASLARPL